MKTTKYKSPKAPHTDKAIARPGIKANTAKHGVPAAISLDTILAEKDEVKSAEEQLRQKKSNKNL